MPTPLLDDEQHETFEYLLLTFSDYALSDQLRALEYVRTQLMLVTREAARQLAHEQSWQAVAEAVGTSRQSAWERWHEPNTDRRKGEIALVPDDEPPPDMQAFVID